MLIARIRGIVRMTRKLRTRLRSIGKFRGLITQISKIINLTATLILMFRAYIKIIRTKITRFYLR
jgi:hypothetical protein